MKRAKSLFILALATYCSLLYLPGCSLTSPEKKAFDTEKLIVSAGFAYRVANTAEKLDKLNSLPQRKLLRHTRQDKVTYLYADVVSCKCVYLGDETAYQRLRRLANDEKLTDKQENGIWSTTRISEAAELGAFFDAAEFTAETGPYLND
jgi:hypothetical protein